MRALAKNYIFPPRASSNLRFEDALEIFTTENWIAQYKFNDSRCLIKIMPSDTGSHNFAIELWNRHAERFRSYTLPDWLHDQIQALTQQLQLTDYTLLDGGLLDQKHQAIKDTITIWDILVHNGEYLLGQTYAQRYQLLTTHLPETPWIYSWDGKNGSGRLRFGRAWQANIFTPDSFPHENWQEAWNNVQQINAPWTTGQPGANNYTIKPILEGLMLKDVTAPLEFGRKEDNNGSWQVRTRVPTGRHNF